MDRASLSLSHADQEAFAQMHRSVLPGSLVAKLGLAYTRSFYDYVDHSEREIALVRRENGQVVAGCVVSLAPGSLSTRLLRETPVLRSTIRAAPQIPWLHLLKGVVVKESRESPPSYPEILLIFTKPAAQGRGYGKALVRETEELVAKAGHKGLRVKTLASPSNQALGFYERCGFSRWGTVSSFGKRLAVLTKSVGTAMAEP